MANPPLQPQNLQPFVVPAGVPKDAIPLLARRPNPIPKLNGGLIPGAINPPNQRLQVQKLTGQKLFQIVPRAFPQGLPRAPMLLQRPQTPPVHPPHPTRKQNRSQKKAEHKLSMAAHVPVKQKPTLPPVVLSKDNFEDQCLEMIAQIEMTPTQRQWIPEVLHDVEDVYRCVLPDLYPKLYGSSFTGIAFKTSDFDVHLHCHCPPEFMPDVKFISKNGHFLYRSPRFRNTIKVGRARVPVMKSTHISGIDLDISATSQHAVHNSILLRAIMDFDPRIRHLTMLISYWAKRNNISGMNLFTSYSIVLMVIFYLQRIDPPILPPMRCLLYRRENVGWPYALRKDAKIECRNEMKVSELFQNFFEFYLNKDFSKKVLSTYLGIEMNVEEFSNFETLTDEMVSYKREVALGELPILISNVIHVQDPIELSVNTTRSVKQDLLALFKEALAKRVEKNKKLPSDRWLHEMTTEEPIVMKKKSRKVQIVISYPTDGENWFEEFNQDFKTAFDLLLFEVEDKMDTNKFIKVDSEGTKKRMHFSYLLSTSYKLTYNKLVKDLKRELLNGMEFEIFKEKFKNLLQNQRKNKFSVVADLNASSALKKKKASQVIIITDINNEPDFFSVLKILMATVNIFIMVARCTRMKIPIKRIEIDPPPLDDSQKQSLLLQNIEKHVNDDEKMIVDDKKTIVDDEKTIVDDEKMIVDEVKTKKKKNKKKKKKGLNNLEQLLDPLPKIIDGPNTSQNEKS